MKKLLLILALVFLSCTDEIEDKRDCCQCEVFAYDMETTQLQYAGTICDWFSNLKYSAGDTYIISLNECDEDKGKFIITFN